MGRMTQPVQQARRSRGHVVALAALGDSAGKLKKKTPGNPTQPTAFNYATRVSRIPLAPNPTHHSQQPNPARADSVQAKWDSNATSIAAISIYRERVPRLNENDEHIAGYFRPSRTVLELAMDERTLFSLLVDLHRDGMRQGREVM